MGKKSPTHRDYGGDGHGRRSGIHRSRLVSKGMISMRCLDCDTLRFLSSQELHRATCPHCLACGGCLEETKQQLKREGRSRVAPSPRSPTNRCCACGARLTARKQNGLFVHLQYQSECRRYYVAEGHTAIDGTIGPYFPGTGMIIKEVGRKWAVWVIDILGQQVTLNTFRTCPEAKACIEDLLKGASDESVPG